MVNILDIMLVSKLETQYFNCKDELNFVMQFLKENYLGYPDKLSEDTCPVCRSLTNELTQKTSFASGYAESVLV